MTFKFIFTGTVHPERASFSLPYPVDTNIQHLSEPCTLRMTTSIYANQVTVVVSCPMPLKDLYTLRNQVVSAVSLIIDAFAVEAFYALDVEIRQVYSLNDGLTLTFGIDTPGLSPPANTPTDIGPHLTAASHTAYYSRAMGDFRRAMAIPSDTGFLCYRAFESLVHDLSRTTGIKNKKLAIIRLNKELAIDPECAEFLRSLGSELRHGHPVSTSGDDRRRALLITQAYIKRYSLRYTQEGAKEPPPVFNLPHSE